MPDIGHACVIKYRKPLKIYLFACKFRVAKGCEKLLKRIQHLRFIVIRLRHYDIISRYLILYKKIDSTIK